MRRRELLLALTACLGLTVSGVSDEAGIGIYGPGAENLKRVMARMGVDSRIVTYGEEIDRTRLGIVVTTPAANRDNPDLFVKTGEIFRRFVLDGGSLLVLHPHRLNWDDGWLPYAVVLGPDAARTVRIEQTSHPVLKGLKQEELGSVNRAKGSVGAWCGITGLDPHWEVIATGEPARAGKARTTVLAEAEYGKGHVVISCFDPFFPDPDKLDSSHRHKLKLLANMLEYALKRQGISTRPSLAGLEGKTKGRRVCLRGEVLSNPAVSNVSVGPAGRVTGLYYKGTGYLRDSGFMLHYNDGADKAGVASRTMVGALLRVRHNVGIEIPTSLTDTNDPRTAYTSLRSSDNALRIDVLAKLSEQRKYLVQEFRITNLSGNGVTNPRLFCFVNAMPGFRPSGYRVNTQYHKETDILEIHNEKDEIVFGLAGAQDSTAHTIDTKSSWGSSEARPGMIEGKTNDKDGGYQAGCLVWDLGDVESGAVKSCVVIMAMGDSFDDLKNEVSAARDWVKTEGGNLAGTVDRTELLARLDRLNWKELTHRYVRDAVNREDLDEDGWSNVLEKLKGTDPENKDTDGDELIDPIDPHPLRPETPIVITGEDISADKPIIGKRREIIRDIRVARVGHFRKADEKALGTCIALFKHLGANSISFHPSSRRSGRARLLCWWKSERFPRSLTDEDYAEGDPLAKIIAACHKNGISVNLYPACAAMGDFYNADMSQKRNPWCSNWTHDVNVARHGELGGYPADLYLIVSEEYGFQTFINRGDAEWGVNGLPCYCELCQARYRREMGKEIPDLAHKGARLKDVCSGKERLEFLRWRYKCYAELHRDCSRAIKERNPDALTMYMGYHGRMGSYNYTRANSWERLGHEGECDYVSVDYYTPRANGLKYFNHLIFPVAIKQLIGAGSKRLGLIEQGEPASSWEPVITYGPQISNIAQGGKGTQFFALGSLMHGAGYQNYGGAGMPVELHKICSTDHFRHLKMAFDTISAINDWVVDASPPKAIALLYCGQGDEVYDFVPELRQYTLGSPKAVQHLFMTYLLRSAYPFDLFYMKYIDYEKLKDYKVIVLPAPFACSEREAEMLERLAGQGCNVLIVGDYGQADGVGNLHKRGMLLDLAGVEKLESANTVVGGVAFKEDSPVTIDTGGAGVKAYAGIVPRPGTRALTSVNGKEAGVYLRRTGGGQVVFMAGDFGSRSISPPRWSARPARQFKITGPGTRLMHSILDYLLDDEKPIINYQVLEDADADVEVTLLENSPFDKVLFAINWEYDAPVTVQAGVNLPEGVYQVTERDLERTRPFALKGKRLLTHEDLAEFQIELGPQMVRILHVIKVKKPG